MYLNHQNDETCDNEYFETIMNFEEGFDFEDIRMDLFRYCKENDFDSILNLISNVNNLILSDIINCRDETGKTPLMITCENGFIDIIELLLPHQTSSGINIYDADGFTALMYAVLKEHFDIVELLLSETSIDINKSGIYGNGETAITLASKLGLKEIVKLLLSNNNIQIRKYDNSGDNALILASKNGHIDIVSMLLSQNGVQINDCNNNNHNALIEAIINGHKEILELLLSQRTINVDQLNKTIKYANDYGNEEVLQIIQNYKI